MAGKQTAVLVKEFNASEPHTAIDIVPTAPIPSPKEGELLVKITCRPVHPADVMALQGFYPSLNQDLPTVPGIEGVGFVVEAGPNAGRKFGKGKRVVGTPFDIGRHNGGSFQEYVTVPEQNLVAVPIELDDQTASQAYINPLTARGLFDVLDIPKGEFLLQSAAGSVLGRQIIQFAKHYGIRTINVVRREEQKKELLDLGADAVLVSTGDSGESIAERVKEITDGKGAYAAVDAVGGELTGKLLEGVRSRGKLLVYGVLSGLSFSAGIPDVLFELKAVSGFHLGHWKDALANETFHKYLEEVIDLLTKGTVTTFNGKSFPLASAAEAVQEAAKAARGGKVFLTS